MEEVVRMAAEVARPLERPMVVLDSAEAAVWRIVEGLVGWGAAAAGAFRGRERIDVVLERWETLVVGFAFRGDGASCC